MDEGRNCQLQQMIRRYKTPDSPPFLGHCPRGQRRLSMAKCSDRRAICNIMVRQGPLPMLPFVGGCVNSRGEI